MIKRAKVNRSAFQRAFAAQRLGNVAEASRLYTEVLARQPEHVEALEQLASLEVEAGQLARAEELLSRLLARTPADARVHANLGEVLRRLGRPQEAIQCMQRALALQPDYPEVLFNLAAVLQQAGSLQTAADALVQAVDLRPDEALFQLALARALVQVEQASRAGLHQRCAALLQNTHDAEVTLARLFEEARTYRAAGDPLAAVACYQAALALEPGASSVWLSLSGTLRELGRGVGAVAAARRAARLEPSSPQTQLALAAALVDGWQLAEALTVAHKALALDARMADGHFHLGRVLLGHGELPQAVTSFRRALELDGTHRAAHSSLIFAMAYMPGCTQATIATEARAWQRLHGPEVTVAPPVRDRTKDRPLRIGYVSSDFYQHPLANFVMPLLQHHDRAAYIVHCYSSVRQPDSLTERIRAEAAVFRDVSSYSDAALAEQVRADRIDILVDLALHSGDHRLRMFAQKPAPVQIGYLGYLGTSGLDSVDYRITAPYLDDPSELASYPESPLELPDAYWCYDPLESAEEPLTALATGTPALARGRITFGTQNSFHKASEPTLRLWARVLAAVPGSRFVMHAPAVGQARVLRAFADAGIERARIEFLPRRPRREYLAAYRVIDLCLDTLPFNGATTSLDAFWMGTPTLTLVGDTPVGRAGLHIAMNLGLPDLVAYTADEFVHKSELLVRDLDQLSALRASLRPRLLGSMLMNAPRFVRQLEQAYRSAWQAWCAREEQ